ncbi:MAG TPA: 4Fe-4S dicluster domain-containing protein [Candidatus Limnocylindria bacterium]|nr:4Fe-4S dicluster domain-containing protein [Candidatus Limnocylindria bacterium]
MAQILPDKCIGCRICQKFCTVEAIKHDPAAKKCYIDQKECVDCYVCLRQQVCPHGAIVPTELDTFYKQFMHTMSDPVENHGVTGVTGRGTEEVKTNDVSGRVRKGRVGLCIDVGRPGAGAYMYDVEKIAMACAAAGVKLEDRNTTPLAALMPDLTTGRLDPEVLNHRLLSVIVEGNCSEEQLPGVLAALKDVAGKIDTVFSLGLIMRIDENGNNPALKCLDDLGIPQPHRGKINVGLGKPLID